MFSTQSKETLPLKSQGTEWRGGIFPVKGLGNDVISPGKARIPRAGKDYNPSLGTLLLAGLAKSMTGQGRGRT